LECQEWTLRNPGLLSFWSCYLKINATLRNPIH
jgi:hypothetical protein